MRCNALPAVRIAVRRQDISSGSGLRQIRSEASRRRLLRDGGPRDVQSKSGPRNVPTNRGLRQIRSSSLRMSRRTETPEYLQRHGLFVPKDASDRLYLIA